MYRKASLFTQALVAAAMKVERGAPSCQQSLQQKKRNPALYMPVRRFEPPKPKV